MTKKITALCIFALLIVIVILGVTIITTKKISLLADSTCVLPCWNNIKLAETNKAELLKILAHVSSVDQASIYRPDVSYQTYDDSVDFGTYSNWLGQRSATGQAWFIKGKVVELIFSGSDITLMQAIQKLGPPDHVDASPLVESSAWNVKIFFKDKGVFVDLLLNSIESDIVPDQNINLVTLVDPNLYQEMLESGEFTDGRLEHTQFIPWSGYGKLKEKYWDSYTTFP